MEADAVISRFKERLFCVADSSWGSFSTFRTIWMFYIQMGAIPFWALIVKVIIVTEVPLMSAIL